MNDQPTDHSTDATQPLDDQSTDATQPDDVTAEAMATNDSAAGPCVARPHRNAYARYVQILTMSGPLGTEQGELERIIADLQLTPEQVESDRTAVARFQVLHRVYAGKSLAVNEQSHRQHLREEAKKRHQNELDEHGRAITHANDRIAACDQAAADLEQLKLDHPELFDVDGHPARLITVA